MRGESFVICCEETVSLLIYDLEKCAKVILADPF